MGDPWRTGFFGGGGGKGLNGANCKSKKFFSVFSIGTALEITVNPFTEKISIAALTKLLISAKLI